jgi:glycosyltransferase involved in cell wall biosynthesis
MMHESAAPIVDVTVAICTRDRCELLERALEALARVEVPNGLRWEVVVVDNGSSDATAGVIARYAALLPLRGLVERPAGLSRARNAAVQAARGAYVLWMDDDVLVERHWLRAYSDAFARWPEVAFFGGPIEPLFEGEPVRWLAGALPNVSNAYAAIDLGPESVALDGDTLPYGANFAVRSVDQRVHRFDPALGRRGARMYAGEEWAIMQALLAEGAQGQWVPAARVRHIIPRDRQSVGYLRRYYFWNGTSLALVRQSRDERMLFGRPRWIWREAVQQELMYRVRRITAPASTWSVHMRRASTAWGMLQPVARR